MKKCILILLAILPNILFAQIYNAQFVYTVDGFRAANNITKDYVMFETKTSDAKENFSQIKIIFSNHILRLKTTNIDDSSFIFGFNTAENLLKKNPTLDMFYAVAISCRDNQVKVQFICNMFQTWEGLLRGGFTVWGSNLIYKKNGNPKKKYKACKIAAEKHANDFVRNLEDKLNGGNNW